MNKTMNMFIAFVAIFVIAFFAIGFTSTVQAPTNATALAQYQNLTETVEIADTGINATLLLLIIGMVIAAIVGAFGLSKRR
jgi:LPXTG-motif cell wall-anchored protein